MTCFGSFAIFDDLWWPLMTYDDFFWPRDQFFSKAFVKSFILTYNLLTFYEVWNLTFFPLLSSFDKDKNLTFLGLFFAIFDLWWPFLTLWITFLKSSRQELHFEVYFVYFWRCPKFDPICPQMPQNDLRAFSQITKKYLDKTESFEGNLRKK